MTSKQNIVTTNIAIAQEFIHHHNLTDEDLTQEIYCLVLSLDEPIRSNPESVYQAISDFTITYLKQQRVYRSHEELRPRLIRGVVHTPSACCQAVVSQCDTEMAEILSSLIIGQMI